jgi:hypothetical protein
MNKEYKNEKSLNKIIPGSILSIIYQAIGEASMCWDNVSGAGVFDSKRATEVAHRLCWSLVNSENVKFFHSDN